MKILIKYSNGAQTIAETDDFPNISTKFNEETEDWELLFFNRDGYMFGKKSMSKEVCDEHFKKIVESMGKVLEL